MRHNAHPPISLKLKRPAAQDLVLPNLVIASGRLAMSSAMMAQGAPLQTDLPIRHQPGSSRTSDIVRQVSTGQDRQERVAIPHQSAPCTGRQIAPKIRLGTSPSYC
jgi:hypothetical protein